MSGEIEFQNLPAEKPKLISEMARASMAFEMLKVIVGTYTTGAEKKYLPPYEVAAITAVEYTDALIKILEERR